MGNERPTLLISAAEQPRNEKKAEHAPDPIRYKVHTEFARAYERRVETAGQVKAPESPVAELPIRKAPKGN